MSVAGGTLPSLPPIMSRSAVVEETDETDTDNNPTVPLTPANTDSEEKVFQWQEKVFSQVLI